MADLDAAIEPSKRPSPSLRSSPALGHQAGQPGPGPHHFEALGPGGRPGRRHQEAFQALALATRLPGWASMQANLGLALHTRFEALGR
ncbi:MAG: hypothetical protein Q9O62_11185 [Ardenticatenia bacterium]|nr:hypothetical protein [Ardenticatenia bacterium]